MRFTTIAHAGRTLLGPLSAARADALARAISMPPDGRIVELGCGKADLLIRLLLVHAGATAEGFDRNPWFLANARSAAEAAGVAGRLSLIETDAPGVRLDGRAVDVAIAMGATGIVGEGRDTLAFLGGIVVPGGEVVFGDGFWAAPPPDDGLASFGMARDELPDGLDGFTALGRSVGLEPITVEAVSSEEWDAYERAYADGIDAWTAAHPDDPERDAFLARSAAMRSSYATWRRTAFGFAIARFRVP
jgi:SAM-dependent methyltransferase